jgi:hypothetical protein
MVKEDAQWQKTGSRPGPGLESPFRSPSWRQGS